MCWRPKDSIKNKSYVFSGLKRKSNACMVYLERKLKQESYGWSIYDLKWKEKVGQIYMETSKEETRYRWFFWHVKMVTEK